MSQGVIEVSSGPLRTLLNQLRDKVENMEPLLRATGEDVVEGIKERFGTATAPDGTPWQKNSPATMAAYIMARGGTAGATAKNSPVTMAAYVMTRGGKSMTTAKTIAKGAKLGASKRPLQGLSGSLAQQFFYDVKGGNELTIYSSMQYAWMQHFGGSKSQFPNLWGDIPARPFFPIRPDGTLYPLEEVKIVDRLRQYLTV